MPQAPATKSHGAVENREEGFVMVAAWNYAASQARSASSATGHSGGLLSFEVGEAIQVLRWTKFGWWWCRRLATDAHGWVASSYLQPSPQLPSPVPEQLSRVGDAIPHEKEASPQAAKQSAPTFPPLPPLPSGSPPTPGDASTDSSDCVWPPLPPGPPPVPTQRMLAARSPAEGTSPEGADTDDVYEQTLGFRSDGRAVPGSGSFAAALAAEGVEGAEMGRMMQVYNRSADYLQKYFDYQAWAASSQASRLGKNYEEVLRPTGDGGFKRRRRNIGK